MPLNIIVIMKMMDLVMKISLVSFKEDSKVRIWEDLKIFLAIFLEVDLNKNQEEVSIMTILQLL